MASAVKKARQFLEHEKAFREEMTFALLDLCGQNRKMLHQKTGMKVSAINYLVQKAESLGQPIVINMSLGGHWNSPHDGTTDQERLIDSLET